MPIANCFERWYKRKIKLIEKCKAASLSGVFKFRKSDGSRCVTILIQGICNGLPCELFFIAAHG
ncbi:hypothetical protein FNO01nite_29630 [Flavobacterium noncentrifugens]|nr:hypothetical protein FNO01nite_29630 [Flavobacterium noncentrifugens]